MRPCPFSMMWARSVIRSSNALHKRVRKHLRPLRERQIRGHDQAGAFGPFGDDLEQQLGADLGQRHVADFIERDYVVAYPSRQHAAHPVVLL